MVAAWSDAAASKAQLPLSACAAWLAAVGAAASVNTRKQVNSVRARDSGPLFAPYTPKLAPLLTQNTSHLSPSSSRDTKEEE